MAWTTYNADTLTKKNPKYNSCILVQDIFSYEHNVSP